MLDQPVSPPSPRWAPRLSWPGVLFASPPVLLMAPEGYSYRHQKTPGSI